VGLSSIDDPTTIAKELSAFSYQSSDARNTFHAYE